MSGAETVPTKWTWRVISTPWLISSAFSTIFDRDQCTNQRRWFDKEVRSNLTSFPVMVIEAWLKRGKVAKCKEVSYLSYVMMTEWWIHERQRNKSWLYADNELWGVTCSDLVTPSKATLPPPLAQLISQKFLLTFRGSTQGLFWEVNPRWTAVKRSKDP